ncbi:hypothetical protein FSARC_927 [Fusarium sarcochroum]|uniref:Uncharacterized protein n=1 Tax=Fusarium sarcochroum TaxID=1208366 RepID=A0A8H4UA01_9HYPO|nr:hypothetical protein FSARC_927 [Fusarium sarcochroum]
MDPHGKRFQSQSQSLGAHLSLAATRTEAPSASISQCLARPPPTHTHKWRPGCHAGLENVKRESCWNRSVRACVDAFGASVDASIKLQWMDALLVVGPFSTTSTRPHLDPSKDPGNGLLILASERHQAQMTERAQSA